MKVNIHINEINETLDVRDAYEALSRLKAEAAKRAPFLMRGVIKALGDVQFAQEAVKRDNSAHGRNDPLPQSAQEFLDWAVERGYASVTEPVDRG